jgi:hypothetical protein
MNPHDLERQLEAARAAVSAAQTALSCDSSASVPDPGRRTRSPLSNSRGATGTGSAVRTTRCSWGILSTGGLERYGAHLVESSPWIAIEQRTNSGR